MSSFHIRQNTRIFPPHATNLDTNHDESTKHGHYFVLPTDERGYLNASRYFGKKKQIVALQDSYAEVMKDFGLERGRSKEDTMANHKSLAEWHNLKVNKVSDILNRDTVTVDRKSYESIKAVNENLTQKVRTIAEAENIEEKEAELQQIKYEIRQATASRDEIESDYLKMKNFITENKSNLDLTIKNAHLEMENNSLREENKLLKNVIKQVSDFIEQHNLPEPIKRGVKGIISSIKQKQQNRGRGR